MLPACILDHIEVKGAVFDPMTELEDLELTLGSLVLLVGEIGVDLIHVLGCVLLPHVLGDLGRLKLGHHCIHRR